MAKKPLKKPLKKPVKKTPVKKRPAKKLSDLPVWDLSDLYAGIADPLITRDLAEVKKQAAALAKNYHGTLASVDAAGLAKAIKAYDLLQDKAGKLASYAQLVYAQDMRDAKVTQFYQNTQEALNQSLNPLVFFTLELNNIPDKTLAAHAKKSAVVAHYMPWILQLRSFKPYQLSSELESYIQQQQVTLGAWQRLFDETIARQKFKLKGKTHNSAEIFDLMCSPKAPLRKAAAKEIARVHEEGAPLFTLITNTLAKAKATEDDKRGFAQPISSRNLANQVEDVVVEALLATVQKNYRNLSHRYYKWKAKQFGKKKLDYWDRNAPLPGADDTRIPWKNAVHTVLEAYEAFSPALAEIGQEFFDKNWIDARVAPGKASGAFAHPVVPSAHPYLLVNYQGKTRDVMTLAHELGHGVHQVLSAKQGALMCDTPLTLAETASVFGEMLTFQHMLSGQKNPRIRTLMIAAKVEDMLNTVVRQIAFCEFERGVHAQRASGELTTADIGKIWMRTQAESLGPAIALHPEYHIFWSYIPHFVHTPFYVYAYAFGDCLVNALYHTYAQEKAAGRGVAFSEKYLNLLQAGGTLHHRELLQPFGLDASRPDFWQRGVDMISGFIDQLTTMEA